ncbi:hypothetical protein COO60DRAFT_1478575 [Scenedesmus sp. NREL 46B-D3]|nr:hypothetical protein COO60DRAFT_1478575 [Scenedesmus sp. NREL 46B-D3]
MRQLTAALYVLGLSVLAGSLCRSTGSVQQLWAALAGGSLPSTAWDSFSSAVLNTYHWLEAHPYPAVIGGMVLYMLALMAFSSYTSRGKHKLQEETLRQQYQAYQTFLHYRRLRAWQAAHPEQAAQEQQARKQQQAPQQEQADRKWGGLMGFGPQEFPEGCSGAVKEVLEAMDFYEVLGVAWNSVVDPKALKAARNARALAVHPDKVATPGADLAVGRVNAAYDTLSSAQARSDYEAWLARQS